MKDSETEQSILIHYNEQEFSVFLDVPQPHVIRFAGMVVNDPIHDVSNVFLLKNLKNDFPFLKEIPHNKTSWAFMAYNILDARKHGFEIPVQPSEAMMPL